MVNWDRFDFKAVSLFSRYPDRANLMHREFDRVGLSDVLDVWSAPSPYTHLIEGRFPCTRMVHGVGLSITLKHQQMVRLAYDSGAQNGLFMEDDIRFLNDQDLLSRIVNSIPRDADLALLDWLHRAKATQAEYDAILNQKKDSLFWVKFNDLRSAGCYFLSRRGMERYLDLLESPADQKGKLRLCDQLWTFMVNCKGCTGYCCIPCAAAQCVPGGNTSYDYAWRKYSGSKMNRSDYAS